MKTFNQNDVREATLFFKKGKYVYKHTDDVGRPPFERCIEVPWVIDKISQVNPNKGDSLFDFGCNKAEYIKTAKKEHSLVTYGIDAKSDGRNFVDHFFDGMFNGRLKEKISQRGPYNIGTAISAIEHAGHKKHPDADYITAYQKEICDLMVQISDYCFISVPFGLRPGWAKDKSRKNLYQFDSDMLDHIKSYAELAGKNYMEEIYRLDGELWKISCRNESKECCYRDAKGGASAVSLVSIWNREEDS